MRGYRVCYKGNISLEMHDAMRLCPRHYICAFMTPMRKVEQDLRALLQRFRRDTRCLFE